MRICVVWTEDLYGNACGWEPGWKSAAVIPILLVLITWGPQRCLQFSKSESTTLRCSGLHRLPFWQQWSCFHWVILLKVPRSGFKVRFPRGCFLLPALKLYNCLFHFWNRWYSDCWSGTVRAEITDKAAGSNVFMTNAAISLHEQPCQTGSLRPRHGPSSGSRSPLWTTQWAWTHVYGPEFKFLVG